MSRFILDEVERVLLYPRIRIKYRITPEEYTAADGKADVLCTRNIRHFAAPEVRSFCLERGIRVMTDLDALSQLLGRERRPGA